MKMFLFLCVLVFSTMVNAQGKQVRIEGDRIFGLPSGVKVAYAGRTDDAEPYCFVITAPIGDDKNSMKTQFTVYDGKCTEVLKDHGPTMARTARDGGTIVFEYNYPNEQRDFDVIALPANGQIKYKKKNARLVVFQKAEEK